MASIRFDEISYAEIATFIKVAQTLSMSHTAKELHISQPAVSKRIANLEHNYGIILFVRTSGRLQLTPAGKVFYKECVIAMEHLKTAFSKASEVQASPIRTLHLGYDGFFDLPILYEIIDRFTREAGQVRIQIHQWGNEDCGRLFDGSADIILCPQVALRDMEDQLYSEPVAAFQFAILVAEGNPLYRLESVTLEDLLGIPLTVARIDAESPYLKNLHRMFNKRGFAPVIDRYVNRESLCFELLSGKGVGIASPRFWRKMDQRTSDFFDAHIRVFPIDGETYPVVFTWRENNPDIQRFIRTFREVVQQDHNRAILDQAYC